MTDFLLKYYGFLTSLVEFLAAIVGVFCFKKYNQSKAKYFIIFLIAIAFSDLFNVYTTFVHPNKTLSFLIGTKFEKNHWWTTLYWNVGAILFYVFYYNQVLKKQIFKNIVKYTGFAFFIFSVVYIVLNWEKLFNQFFVVLHILGAFIVFLCSIFYFLEVLMNDKIITFYKSINFYITVAIFIWWLVITPLAFYDIYFSYELGKSNRDLDFMFLRWQIYLFANIFMYLTFTFALIYCKPEHNND